MGIECCPEEGKILGNMDLEKPTHNEAMLDWLLQKTTPEVRALFFQIES